MMIVSELLHHAQETGWGAQTNYRFGRDLTAGTLNKTEFEHGVNQDYHSLIAYTHAHIGQLFWQSVEHKAVSETADKSVTEECDVEDREGSL